MRPMSDPTSFQTSKKALRPTIAPPKFFAQLRFSGSDRLQFSGEKRTESSEKSAKSRKTDSAGNSGKIQNALRIGAKEAFSLGGLISDGLIGGLLTVATIWLPPPGISLLFLPTSFFLGMGWRFGAGFLHGLKNPGETR